MRPDSNNSRLAAMEVGQYIYVECEPDEVAQVMRSLNTPKSRRPKELQDREFTCSAFTAVPAANCGTCITLVKLERVS